MNIFFNSFNIEGQPYFLIKKFASNFFNIETNLLITLQIFHLTKKGIKICCD